MTVLLTPATAQAVLDRYGLATRRRDGQHLLVDPNTVRRIVAAAELDPDDVVLEVGPGIGSLTLGLADAVRRVVTVELDAGFVTALHDVLATADVTNVEVVHGDALAIDLPGLVGGGPARLVANLPYNVATAIVVEALASGAFDGVFVMVQREVGERWAARAGQPAYSGVSAKLGVLATVTVTLRIPRGVFLPIPNVDSVMVRLDRLPDAPDTAGFARIARVVDTAFAQRRKTLRNTLRDLGDAAVVAGALGDAGVDPGARPETLDPAAFVRLADTFIRSGVDLDAPAPATRP
jgi:16S rRNA (adenine1518-N6/adenine1519-N6)-dimethyltransferase